MENLDYIVDADPEPARGNGNNYIDGHGNRVVNVHPETDDCREFGCSVHNPTGHNMRHMPTLFRQDRGITERVCEHGIGHPDPDNLAYIERRFGKDRAGTESVHGCDGCCDYTKSPKKLIEELRENLYANVAILLEFPDYDVFGLKEIHANTKQSIRYIGKLEDKYLCMRCKEEHGDEPTVQYFKARVHHSCFIEHFGQEKFDRVLETQEMYE